MLGTYNFCWIYVTKNTARKRGGGAIQQLSTKYWRQMKAWVVVVRKKKKQDGRIKKNNLFKTHRALGSSVLPLAALRTDSLSHSCKDWDVASCSNEPQGYSWTWESTPFLCQLHFIPSFYDGKISMFVCRHMIRLMLLLHSVLPCHAQTLCLNSQGYTVYDYSGKWWH